MKPFVVLEMTFKGHSRSSAMSFYLDSRDLIRDQKDYIIFREK